MSEKMQALRRLIAVSTVSLVMAAGLTVATATAAAADVPSTPAPVAERNDDVVTADPLPAPQIENGVIWAQVTIGNVVYAAGRFDNVRPAGAAPGTNLIPRSNILAFDITTGELLPFAPAVNGTIRALAKSPDGSRLYIGGSFNRVGADTRWNFAAINPQTGSVVPGFSPAIGGTGVYGIAATADTVFTGGLFTQGNGVARKNLAAFATSNGALRPWAPVTDLQVDALVMQPGDARVIAGGRFARVNDVTQRGLVALEPASGAIDTSWVAPQTVVNGASTGTYAGKAGIFALATDDTGVYGTGWAYAPWSIGNLEGVFAAEAASGEIRWVADCHGDHYGVYSTGKTVYATSHTHACETTGLAPELNPRQYRYMEAFTAEARGTLPASRSLSNDYKNWQGTPSPSAYTVAPDFTVGTTSGLGQAGLSITGAGGYISVAGEFTSVNNQQYQGIVRFSTSPASGKKQGPRLSAATWAAPTAQAVLPGRVRVAVQTNYDRDNRDLTYELLRNDLVEPVASTTVGSFWWTRSSVALTDSTATPGQAYTYRVRARDVDGNAVTSAPVAVTATNGVPMPYANAVLDGGANLYYPMGSVAADWAGANPPRFSWAAGTVSPGAVTGASADASTFNGTQQSFAASTVRIDGPQQFTQEVWFKTRTTRGGKLIGFGSSSSDPSGSYDRHIYMQNDGRLRFGVYPGTTKTVLSSKAYNDGDWHQAVASLGSGGMALYVDGALVASDPTTTSAEPYSGYWRIGGDSLGSWPSQPSSMWFNGAIDEVAVYPTVLSAAEVAAHYALGTGEQLPVPAFTTSTADLVVDVDGSGSTTPSGTIVEYAWDFGDGTPVVTSALPTAQHEYSAPGTYTVSLVVKDSRGLVATSTSDVTTIAANVPPVADFTVAADGLTASADASSSADADGALVEYRWDWGDGSAPATGITASHRYGAAGDYTVTMTVTDDRGATASHSAPIQVTHAAPIADVSITTSGLDITADSSASRASDDASMTHSWDWGDGSTIGSGAVATHTFSAPGTYTVTVTVTDSYGATDTASEEVTVSRVLHAVSDDFGRTVSAGWGAADVGGTWTPMYAPASNARVLDGVGQIVAAPGVTLNMAQQGVDLRDTRTSLEFSLSTTPASGSSYVGVTARQRAGGDYTTRVWMRNDGTVWLVAQRTGTVLKAQPIAGLTWSAGDRFSLVAEVEGQHPTSIRAKVWKAGSAEPGSWQLTTTDSTEALQTPGYGAVHVARTGSAASTTTASVDAYRVTDLAVPQVLPPVAAATTSSRYLDVTADASGTQAPSAPIVDYTWRWGDGSAPDSGVTATHGYAAPGVYAVTLTVTDEFGQKATTTTAVDVKENQAPTAGFTTTVAGLMAAADASSSTDPEGGPLTYSWNWGDGTPDGSGVTADHRFEVAGTYQVTLTVTDEKGATSVQTHDVEVVNAPPVASFTTSATALTVVADASASQDAEGAIAEYVWDWGDGSTGSGVSAEHAYAASGSYTVTLTVVDADGLSAQSSASIVVDEFLIADDFTRDVAAGWGSLDGVTPWTVTAGSAGVTSVSGGAGRVVLPPGQTRNLLLNGVSAQDVVMTVDFALSTQPSEGSAYAGVIARSVGADNYTVRTWMHANGSMWIAIQRGTTLLSAYTVPGLTRSAGDVFTMKVSVTGGASTTIAAKLWRAGTPEPAEWQSSFTDVSGLASTGAVGVHVSRSGAATTTGTTSIDTFRVAAVG